MITITVIKLQLRSTFEILTSNRCSDYCLSDRKLARAASYWSSYTPSPISVVIMCLMKAGLFFWKSFMWLLTPKISKLLIFFKFGWLSFLPYFSQPNPKHVGIAFNSLQYICTDFIGQLKNKAMLTRLIKTIGSYSAPLADINIAITSNRLLWSVSDYIATDLATSLGI